MAVKKIILTSLILVVWSCNSNDKMDFRVETDVKYPLQQWPDSNYLSSIDSILKAEVLKPTPRKSAEVSMPGLVKASDLVAKNPAGKTAQTVQKAVVVEASPEKFLQKFQSGLEKSMLDPSATQKATPHQGESLAQLLIRVYGPLAEHLPMFVVKAQLSKLNPDQDLDNLQGEPVSLPLL